LLVQRWRKFLKDSFKGIIPLLKISINKQALMVEEKEYIFNAWGNPPLWYPTQKF
jgi:hypothetical protein